MVIIDPISPLAPFAAMSSMPSMNMLPLGSAMDLAAMERNALETVYHSQPYLELQAKVEALQKEAHGFETIIEVERGHTAREKAHVEDEKALAVEVKESHEKLLENLKREWEDRLDNAEVPLTPIPPHRNVHCNPNPNRRWRMMKTVTRGSRRKKRRAGRNTSRQPRNTKLCGRRSRRCRSS